MNTNNSIIDHDYVEKLIDATKKSSRSDILAILGKAGELKGLSHDDVAKLINIDSPELMKEVFKAAGDIKDKIYGNRVVIFAPLYISDYCVNSCRYCGYKHGNEFPRRRLTFDEIRDEVRMLEKMGHKRLALEVGEDPVNCPIDYVLEAIDTIYDTFENEGSIRRINVNIAATTVENYKMLKDKKIGTYILFQETYHKPTYEYMHPKSVKGDYSYHIEAFDRAMEAGLDDVGGGVLFGLYDYRFEVVSLLLHNQHLEEKSGVGFHTVSVPRIKKAEGMDLVDYPHLITDDEFKKVVAVLRLAIPFAGIILSTRETSQIRKEVINYGVSQVSSGSCTGVGGYKESQSDGSAVQFEVGDERSSLDINKDLLENGFIPSYCTACYRSGRTGDRFMELAKTGQIGNVCQPNALMTLKEYADDYGDDEIRQKAKKVIEDTFEKIDRQDIKSLLKEKLKKIENGERDLFL